MYMQSHISIILCSLDQYKVLVNMMCVQGAQQQLCLSMQYPHEGLWGKIHWLHWTALMKRRWLVLSEAHKHNSPVIQSQFRRLHWTVVMKWESLSVGELHKHCSPSLLFSQAVLVFVREPHSHRVVGRWNLMTYVV